MKKSILLFLLAIACLGLAVTVLLTHIWTPTYLAKPSATYSEAGYIYALAIDMDGESDMTSDNLLQGKHVIIVANLAKLKEGETVLHAFNGLSSLMNYDKNSDNVIDPQDPVYSVLDVVSLAEGKFRSNSLEKAGIRAILINPEYFAWELEDDPDRFNAAAGTAIMADGHRRVVREVPLNLDKLHDTPVLPIDVR